MQILQSRQGNLEEGKGKEFPCCTCWRLKHSLETPAGTTQGVRRGALKCPRCSATPPLSLTLRHSHIHPSKTSTSTSTRSLNAQPPAAAGLWDSPGQRHSDNPGPLAAGSERHRAPAAAASQRHSAASARSDLAGNPGGSPAPRRALTFDAITAN